MLSALLWRERDHVDALLHLADSVWQGAATMDQVELGLAPSGFRRIAREREFLSGDGSRNVQQLIKINQIQFISVFRSFKIDKTTTWIAFPGFPLIFDFHQASFSSWRHMFVGYTESLDSGRVC